jgi:hypothetical protein
VTARECLTIPASHSLLQLCCPVVPCHLTGQGRGWACSAGGVNFVVAAMLLRRAPVQASRAAPRRVALHRIAPRRVAQRPVERAQTESSPGATANAHCQENVAMPLVANRDAGSSALRAAIRRRGCCEARLHQELEFEATRQLPGGPHQVDLPTERYPLNRFHDHDPDVPLLSLAVRHCVHLR